MHPDLTARVLPLDMTKIERGCGLFTVRGVGLFVFILVWFPYPRLFPVNFPVFFWIDVIW